MNVKFLISRGLLIARKYAPDVLVGLGVVGGVTATALAVKATYDLIKNDDLKDARELREGTEKLRQFSIEDAQDGTNKLEKYFGLKEYTEEMYRKDIIVCWIRKATPIVKRYAIPFGIGAASVACILGAHGLMKQRNAALMVAYSALEAAYKNYRKRVVEKYGEDVDRELAEKHDTIQYQVLDNDGNPEGEIQEGKVHGSSGLSPYARYFDTHHPEWQQNTEFNLYWLKCRQNYANDMLRSRGHLFLNEVYDSLGMPRSKAGAVVGWLIDAEGDGFVDFGLFRGGAEKARDVTENFESSILLDFNVDGVIYDKI